MGKLVGAVRYQNGHLDFFLWNTVPDVAQPRLFDSVADAEAAWENELPQHDAWEALRGGDREKDGEPVEVIVPYRTEGPNEVFFLSRADRQLRLITGPLDLDSSDQFGLL